MANIKQQKKRVGIAARQRLENLRYKSTARTLLKSLQDHVNLGEKERATEAHGKLVKLLDRAAAKHALHPNTVNRKKSRATRVLASDPVIEAKTVRRAKKKAVPRKKAETAAAPKAAPKSAAKTATPAKAAEATAAPAEATEELATDAPESATPVAPQVDEEAVAPETEAVADEAPAEDAPAEESTEG